MIRHVSPTFFFHILTSWQSIQVVECPEFRHLYMVLQESLINTDIPHYDKMRDAIISRWWKTFEDLRDDLSMRLNDLFPTLTNWHWSIEISRVDQLYCWHLGKLQYGVLLGLDRSLDLPWCHKCMPCTQSSTDQLPSPQEEPHRRQYRKDYLTPIGSCGRHIQGMYF